MADRPISTLEGARLITTGLEERLEGAGLIDFGRATSGEVGRGGGETVRLM